MTSFKLIPGLLGACALMLVGVMPAHAAVDMFIKIEGIDGEAKDADHKGEIDILSWSWGESRSSSGMSSRPAGTQVAPSQSRVLVAPRADGGGQTGATRRRGETTLGDVSVVKELDKSSPRLASSPPRSGSGAGEFSFTKYVDKASPKLQQYCASGQLIPELVLSDDKKKKLQYIKYELTNVMITSCARGSKDGKPTESISMNYQQIKWTYGKKGRQSGKTEVRGWDGTYKGKRTE